MRILALDQSSNVTGWAVFDNTKLEKYGIFEAGDSSTPLQKRLTKIRNIIKQFVEEYNIEKVLIEDIQMQANVANNVVTYKALAEVIGVITELLNEMKIPFELIPASTWKSTLKITGRNRAQQKANAAAYVETTYGIKATQDCCDAICIGTHFVSDLMITWPE